jgi:hypothetical protein
LAQTAVEEASIWPLKRQKAMVLKIGQMQVQKLIFADIRKRLVPTGGSRAQSWIDPIKSEKA